MIPPDLPADWPSLTSFTKTNKAMKKKKEQLANQHGLDIEVESGFIPETGEWMFDEYNVAKLLVYRDMVSLLPPDEEQKRIALVMSVGIFRYLDEAGGGESCA